MLDSLSQGGWGTVAKVPSVNNIAASAHSGRKSDSCAQQDGAAAGLRRQPGNGDILYLGYYAGRRRAAPVGRHQGGCIDADESVGMRGGTLGGGDGKRTVAEIPAVDHVTARAEGGGEDGWLCQLNSFDSAVRAEALDALLRLSPARPSERPVVNMHMHTFFSFNGEGLSPSSLAYISAPPSGSMPLMRTSRVLPIIVRMFSNGFIN